MRLMQKGQPFADVPAEFSPDDWDGEKPPPTFSEAFLYPTVGKTDARFISGVADEYSHVIAALGPRAVARLLAVRPRLAQRLGIGDELSALLEDAVPEEDLRYEERVAPQVTLDHEAAHAVWRGLHAEYTQHFNPEVSMDRDSLRAYNTLTEAFGAWAIGARQKERDRLPEKLEKQEERKAVLEARKATRGDRRAIVQRVLEEEGAKEEGAKMPTSGIAAQIIRELDGDGSDPFTEAELEEISAALRHWAHDEHGEYHPNDDNKSAQSKVYALRARFA